MSTMITDFPRRAPVLARGHQRRRRSLRHGAAVVAEASQPVHAWDPVGQAPAAALPEVLDVAGTLGVRPDQAAQLVARQGKTCGDVVAPGEPLAESPGLLGIGRRVCRAPRAGVLAYVSEATGIALLAPIQPAPRPSSEASLPCEPPAPAGAAGPASRAPSDAKAEVALPLEIRAHLTGVVTQISPSAVTVEGPATALRGIAGAGPAISGPLALLGEGSHAPDAEEQSSSTNDGASAATLDARPRPRVEDGGFAGAICASRHPVEWADVARLASRGAAGLIAPAADEQVWQRLGVVPAAACGRLGEQAAIGGLAAQPSLALVLTDELPRSPSDDRAMSPPLWSELETWAGQTVAILGYEPGCAPEALLPHRAEPPGSGTEANEAAAPPPTRGSRPHTGSLLLGALVRVTAGHRAGTVGRVAALSERPRRFPSEVVADAARLDLSRDESLWVPLVNLELLAPAEG